MIVLSVKPAVMMMVMVMMAFMTVLIVINITLRVSDPWSRVKVAKWRLNRTTVKVVMVEMMMLSKTLGTMRVLMMVLIVWFILNNTPCT